MTARIARAEIDLTALRHNFSLVRSYAVSSRIMCVVKANAYGHGILPVAEALSETDAYAVACVEEAVLLRQNGIVKPITVFQGFIDEAELIACADYDLWPLIHSESQIDLLQQTEHKCPGRLWLKLTSGMNRLGFPCEQAEQLWQGLNQLAGVSQVGLTTHMACADEGKSSQSTQKQINRFETNTASLQTEKSLANSATLLSWPQARADWVRPGIMLYGISPFSPGVRHDCLKKLHPVMRLSSRLIAINHCRKGDSVGYGSIWQCPQDMPVGVVAIGYGDGYPRHINASACVVINGKRAKIIGRVSMDLLTIDLRNTKAEIGDSVVLWGPELPVEEIAQSAETIAYELTCAVYGRVQYQYHA